MKIIQILPELNEGGVERGTIELSRELVKRGFESVVISHGGKLVEQIEKDGGLHVKLDVCSKNIFTAPFRIFKLYQTLKTLNPNILHVRSRVPAWMVFFANTFFHRTRVWPMRNSSRMQGNHTPRYILTTHEITSHII